MSLPRFDIIAVLEGTALFASLSQEELRTLAARTVRKPFKTGELLFSEGENCHGLHIIGSGKVRIFKTSVSGREQVLAVNHPGESVAELPVFDGGNYPASAIAVDATDVFFLPREEFRGFCLERPEVALKVLAAVGGRLRKLVDLIEELSFTTVRQRLATLLVKLAKTAGRKTAEGVAFDLPDSHQEMAHRMGTVRELISRNLTRLAAEGLIRVDGKHIVVREMAGLEEAAGDEG